MIKQRQLSWVPSGSATTYVMCYFRVSLPFHDVTRYALRGNARNRASTAHIAGLWRANILIVLGDELGQIEKSSNDQTSGPARVTVRCGTECIDERKDRPSWQGNKVGLSLVTHTLR